MDLFSKTRGLIVLIGLSPGLCSAQQPDRKDYIIQALETQRNEALAREAICRADDAVMIADLRKQISDLKDQIAKASEHK